MNLKDKRSFIAIRRYVALAMKVVITFALLGLITYNTQLKQTEEPNVVWYTLLGNILQMWVPSLAKDDDEEKK